MFMSLGLGYFCDKLTVVCLGVTLYQGQGHREQVLLSVTNRVLLWHQQYQLCGPARAYLLLTLLNSNTLLKPQLKRRHWL